MAFIYLPSITVQPYKVFGVAMFAVECVGHNYSIIEPNPYRIQLGWFFDVLSANNYAEKVIAGDD